MQTARNTLTKKQAMRLLDCETLHDLATVLGVSPSAITQWPDPLSPNAENRVLAEAYRLRLQNGGCRNCQDD